MNKEAEKLFTENQSLVSYVLYKLLGYKGPESEDLQQIGYMYLWKACLNFDEDKGYKFATYAVPTIKKGILRYIRENTEKVKVPRSYITIRSIINKHNFTFPLSNEEISIIVNEGGSISEKLVRKYENINYIPLDSPISLDESMTYSDIISDNSDFREDIECIKEEKIDELIYEVLKYFKVNKSNYRDLIEEYLYAAFEGINLKQVDLCKKYNISQSQVAKILKKAREGFLKDKENILKLFGIT